jgi:hypothetical protein
MKEWQTFVRRYADMKEGKRELFIKDLTDGKAKYATRHVIGTVSKSEKRLSNPDRLWVRGESGQKDPEPWYLDIEKELEEWIPGKPWEDVLEALEKRRKNLA